MPEQQNQPSPESISDPLRDLSPTLATIVEDEVPLPPEPVAAESGESQKDPVTPNCLVKLRISPEDSGVPEQNRYKGIWTTYFVRKDWCTKANRRKLTNIFPSFYLLEVPLTAPFSRPTAEFQTKWASLALSHYLLAPIRLLRRRSDSGDLRSEHVELIGMKFNRVYTDAEGHALTNGNIKVIDRCFNGVWVPHPTRKHHSTMVGFGTEKSMLNYYKRGAEVIDKFVVESINQLGGLF